MITLQGVYIYLCSDILGVLRTNIYQKGSKTNLDMLFFAIVGIVITVLYTKEQIKRFSNQGTNRVICQNVVEK